MEANLLERDGFLYTLGHLLSKVEKESGQIALISGEAGIGKTSLVEVFLQKRPPATRVLWGSCEALFTPCPLGPLYDLASQTNSPLRTLLEGESTTRATLFAAVLEELTPSGARLPTILVLEDIHWADEATLDFIKFLARRIHRTRALLVLTYRDDELRNDHPLRLVLGDLPASAVTRLHLPPLSEAAVEVLANQAGRASSSRELYMITSGNPFFLVETLASQGGRVPSSVSDAVLAQVARCSPEAQRFLELVAVVPGRTPGWLVEAASVFTEQAKRTVILEECLAAGLLRLEEAGAIRYRHELARQAVEDGLSGVRRRELHAQVLHLLLALSQAEPAGSSVSLARLVHHAALAEDATRVLGLAPLAARQAAVQGAHREAAAHYRRALEYADGVPAEQRAALLDGLASECSLYGQTEEALQAGNAALLLWRSLEQSEKVGHTLLQLSRAYSFLANNEEAERYAIEAVELLETLRPSRELAMAYANLSHLRMIVSDSASSTYWGERALEIAEHLHDTETICSALNYIGTSLLCSGDERGLAKVDAALQLAREHSYEEQVVRAYVNLAIANVQHRNYSEATSYFQDGLAYCTEHGLEGWDHMLRANWALARFEQGDWTIAEEDVSAILSVPRSASVRIPALRVLGLLRTRRGDSGAEAALDELRDLALATGETQCISPMAAARAEWRWLQGDDAGCVAEAEVGFALALASNRPWSWGQVAIWLWRGGGLRDVPSNTPAAFALQVEGDWQGAAATWEQIGCPYERALALLDGDEAAQRSALTIFERLGARPAAERARRRLRGAGVRILPRGPRPTTQANPGGLTNRQLEILLLLAKGLSNPEIAELLSTTPKTVEHHVSAVLAKLGARSRAQAVRVAYEQHLIAPSESRKSAATFG